MDAFRQRGCRQVSAVERYLPADVQSTLAPGFVLTRLLEAIEVFGERHRARVHPCDHSSRFRLSS
jgi:hypothetical protein